LVYLQPDLKSNIEDRIGRLVAARKSFELFGHVVILAVHVPGSFAIVKSVSRSCFPATSGFIFVENARISIISLNFVDEKADFITKHKKSGDFSKTKGGPVSMHSRCGPTECMLRLSSKK